MKNIQSALKALLIKRNEESEELINDIAAPLNRCCLDCIDGELLAGLLAEFRGRCADAGHFDVVELLDIGA